MRKTAGSDVLKEESLLGPLAVSCLGGISLSDTFLSQRSISRTAASRVCTGHLEAGTADRARV